MIDQKLKVVYYFLLCDFPNVSSLRNFSLAGVFYDAMKQSTNENFFIYAKRIPDYKKLIVNNLLGIKNG